jgi:hypothetical protein
MMLRPHVLAAALCTALSGAAQATQIPEQPLDFTVTRNGEAVGKHVVTFRRMEDGVAVDVSTNVAVKMAFITVYRFEHQGSELWRGDRLVSLRSTTNDDGTPHTLQVHATGSKLQIVGDGASSTADPPVIPASLWNNALVSEPHLLNTLDGRLMSVSTQELGEEQVSVRGRPARARHYVVRGELERELWYDALGTLVRVRFKGRDGSDIVYELR